MRIFTHLYNKVMSWAKHRLAPAYLAGLSFSEASFFPIPPDVLLIPMCLGRPQQSWLYASLTTLSSTLGGFLGYCIGWFAFILVQPYLQHFGYMHAYLRAEEWFHLWGFLALFIAAFSPVPYKVFTIAAGSLHMALLPFIVASFIGRGLRFFLVAGLIRWGGEPMEAMIRRYVDFIGWVTVIMLVIVYLFWR